MFLQEPSDSVPHAGTCHRLGPYPCVVFRSRAAVVAENLFLRRQRALYLERNTRRRPTPATKFALVILSRFFPWASALAIVKPDTFVRWHRTGFRLFWRWKSRRRAGRPALSADIRGLVRRISRENPLWGAPRIHGELLKLGIEIAQSTVA